MHSRILLDPAWAFGGVEPETQLANVVESNSEDLLALHTLARIYVHYGSRISEGARRGLSPTFRRSPLDVRGKMIQWLTVLLLQATR